VLGLDAIHADFDKGQVGQQNLNNLQTLDRVSVYAKGLMLEFVVWRYLEKNEYLGKLRNSRG